MYYNKTKCITIMHYNKEKYKREIDRVRSI